MLPRILLDECKPLPVLDVRLVGLSGRIGRLVVPRPIDCLAILKQRRGTRGSVQMSRVTLVSCLIIGT